MKKLSRKIVWLLLIVFVFTVGSGFSLRRSAALPGVGEQLSGFRVETIERLDTPGGKTAYLTHEATGAAVVYIEDTGASPALTLMARTTDGLRRVTLTADSVAELLRGAKESLGAFFGAETEAVPGAEAAYRAFLTYLLPGSDTAGNGAGPVSAENMLAVVCADADGAEDILSWLDGVFSAADAGEALAPDAAYCRIEKPVKETVSLAGEGTGGVYFGIVCPRAGEWTRVRLAALAAALERTGSLLDKSVCAALPDTETVCGTASAGADAAIWFFAPGLEEKDAEVFRDAVLAALRSAAGGGFSDPAVETLSAAQRLEELTFPERDDLGAALCEGFAAAWAQGDASGLSRHQLRAAVERGGVSCGRLLRGGRAGGASGKHAHRARDAHARAGPGAGANAGSHTGADGGTCQGKTPPSRPRRAGTPDRRAAGGGAENYLASPDRGGGQKQSF